MTARFSSGRTGFADGRATTGYCHRNAGKSYRDLFDEQACKEADEKETAEALEAYRENHRTTEEERMEMRAAFGEGAAVVDVISGERIRL